MHARRRTPTLLWSVCAAAVLVVGSACSAPDETTTGASPVAAESGALPATIEHEFGSTTVTTAPQRVAAMGVGDSDTLLAVGVHPTTVAPFGTPDQATAPWNEKLVGDTTPVVLSNSSAEFGAQIAKTLATNPDLVTAVGAAPTRDQYDLLAKTTPTIVRPAGYPDWQVPWELQAIEIGKAVGLPEAVARKIADAKGYQAGVRGEHPEFAGKTGVVITGAPDGGVSVYGPTDGRGQTLAGYGLKFPEQLAPVITNGFYGSLSAENLNRLDAADVIVAVDWSGANDRLKASPAFSSLSASKAGRVVYASQMVGNAMSVPTVLTIPWVGGQLVGPLAAAISG